MIIHLCVLDKFIEPFYRFLTENFPDHDSRHKFYINKTIDKYASPVGDNVFLAQNFKSYVRYAWLVKEMNQAEKIILHGLNDMRVLILLCMQPWLLKKCFWAIWGVDLYTYQLGDRTLGWWRNEFFRRFAIKRLGHFITHIKGDYKLAQQWYGAQGEWHECFMYPSNLYQEAPAKSFPHKGVNILLGNSADPTNNHIEVLDNLKCYADESIRIYCPLSYGDQSYAQKVSDYGSSLFGEKFIALRDFMPLNKYNELLAEIDIAIFNHNRQQGMGNTTSLLGMGKKVFIREGVTPYMMFESIGVKVYPINNLDLNLIAPDVALANCMAVKNYFSIDRLKEQWGMIYE